MAESRHDSTIFVEKLYEQSLTINASNNQFGLITIDNNSNYIADYLSGNRVVYKASGGLITSGSFVNAKSYTINTLGTTDFTLIGASSNTIGVTFTATGVGSGTGTAYLNTLTLTSGTGILIYDSKNFCLLKGGFNTLYKARLDNMYNSMVLKDTETTYYKFDANIDSSNDFSGSSTVMSTFTTISHTAFKVYLNNKLLTPITDYTVSGSTITFINGYKDFNNYCTIIYYLTTQNIGSQSIILYFKQAYKSLMTASNYFDGIPHGSTFTRDSTVLNWMKGSTTAGLQEGMNIKIGTQLTTITSIVGNDFYTFDNITTTTTTTPYKYYGLAFNSVDDDYSITNNDEYFEFDTKGTKTPFRKKIKQRKSITFSQWLSETYNSNLYSYPIISRNFNEYFSKDDIFRIYFVNSYESKVEILTNAKIYDDSSKSYNSDGNKLSTNIIFEDQIMTVDKQVNYGDGTYSSGYYGGFKVVRT